MKKTKPIIFLDYDGVVNTIYWREYPKNPNHPRGLFRADYATPEDGFVNNIQAICWLNELYKEWPYDIVVTSTWRFSDNYKECLYNGGLNKEITILGKTPRLNSTRGEEIKTWMVENQYNGEYVILDDDDIKDFKGVENHLIQCDQYCGFGVNEVCKILKKVKK